VGKAFSNKLPHTQKEQVYRWITRYVDPSSSAQNGIGVVLVKLEEYAWNKHEQKLKAEQTEFKHSDPKIKIIDNTELRNKNEENLENMPQKLLAQWALKVSTSYLDFLDDHLKDDLRINLGIETL
jgi:N-acetylmuramoyl-L-alanine amidase CwlA